MCLMPPIWQASPTIEHVVGKMKHAFLQICDLMRDEFHEDTHEGAAAAAAAAEKQADKAEKAEANGGVLSSFDTLRRSAAQVDARTFVVPTFFAMAVTEVQETLGAARCVACERAPDPPSRDVHVVPIPRPHSMSMSM